MLTFPSRTREKMIHTLHWLLHSSQTPKLSWSTAESPSESCRPQGSVSDEENSQNSGPGLEWRVLYTDCWEWPTFPSWEWAEGAPAGQGICALSVTALAVASWALYMKYGIFTHPGNATIKQGTGAVYDWASCWVQLNLLFPIRFNVRIKWMLPEIWRRIICQ